MSFTSRLWTKFPLHQCQNTTNARFIRNIGKKLQVVCRCYQLFLVPKRSQRLLNVSIQRTVRFYSSSIKDATSLRAQLDTIGNLLSIVTLEDWYKVKVSKNKQLNNLVRREKSTLDQILRRAYPDHSFLTWKFDRMPHSFWRSPQGRKEFLDWALENLRPSSDFGSSLDRWYSVTAHDVISLGGRTLILDEYEGSLIKCLQSTYSPHEFLEWRFKGVPTTFWQKLENRRRFFLYLVKDELQRDPLDLDSWYRLGNEDVDRAGGSGLIQGYHSNSVSQAIMEIFPEHSWQPWRFSRCPSSFWAVPDNQRRYLLEWALPRIKQNLSLDSQKNLGPISATSDLEIFYTIPNKVLIEEGASALLKRYDYSIPRMCREIFPDHLWDSSKFTKNDNWKPRATSPDANRVETSSSKG